MKRNDLDFVDRRLLALLQRDASRTLDWIAEKVELSPTACWRRIQRLRELGIMGARVDLLDQEALGFALTGFVAIRTDSHAPDWTRRFIEAISALPAVMEFYRVAGASDYIIKIVIRDMASYNQLYRTIIDIGGVTDMSATFSMETLKRTTELPVEQAD